MCERNLSWPEFTFWREWSKPRKSSVRWVWGTLLVAQLVEALRHKPEGRRFDSRWCHWNYLWLSCTMALGLTQPLTEMSIRNISWGQKWPVRRADKLTTFHVPIVLKSGSLNLLEPSGPVQACNGIALPFFMCQLQGPAYLCCECVVTQQDLWCENLEHDAVLYHLWESRKVIHILVYVDVQVPVFSILWWSELDICHLLTLTPMGEK